jgi:putative glutamine amidotransferase
MMMAPVDGRRNDQTGQPVFHAGIDPQVARYRSSCFQAIACSSTGLHACLIAKDPADGFPRPDIPIPGLPIPLVFAAAPANLYVMTQSSSYSPLIAVPACVRNIDGKPFHTVGDKYVRAVSLATGGLPVMLPSLGELIDIRQFVARLDGLLMTGSPSNVHPTHYGTAATPEAEPHDPDRDATSLPLIREAVRQGVPLFAICRGLQELNVAFGGTLHSRVHEISGKFDHRQPKHDDPDVQYGPRHPAHLVEGGLLCDLLGKSEITINSLHWQAVDRLGDGLSIEALAHDGTVEAIKVDGAKAFALGVQWHPEYKVMDNEDSLALFRAFGQAAQARAVARAAGSQKALSA